MPAVSWKVLSKAREGREGLTMSLEVWCFQGKGGGERACRGELASQPTATWVIKTDYCFHVTTCWDDSLEATDNQHRKEVTPPNPQIRLTARVALPSKSPRQHRVMAHLALLAGLTAAQCNRHADSSRQHSDTSSRTTHPSSGLQGPARIYSLEITRFF